MSGRGRNPLSDDGGDGSNRKLKRTSSNDGINAGGAGPRKRSHSGSGSVKEGEQ
jgi:hypothetical protein